MTIKFSKHGALRANQRGFSEADIILIRDCGTQIPDRTAEVYLLKNNDVQRKIRGYKQKIQRLERMRGCEVVISDDQLITVHHTSNKHRKRLLQRTG